jgi:hypothetical protein
MATTWEIGDPGYLTITRYVGPDKSDLYYRESRLERSRFEIHNAFTHVSGMTIEDLEELAKWIQEEIKEKHIGE